MDGTYACSYTPVKAIKHTIAVVWGGVNIPHSPYRVGLKRNPGRGVKKPSPEAGLDSMLDGQGRYMETPCLVYLGRWCGQKGWVL